MEVTQTSEGMVTYMKRVAQESRRLRTCVKSDTRDQGLQNAVAVPAKKNGQGECGGCAVLLVWPVREAACLAQKRAVIIVIL